VSCVCCETRRQRETHTQRESECVCARACVCVCVSVCVCNRTCFHGWLAMNCFFPSIPRIGTHPIVISAQVVTQRLDMRIQ